jgi:hypothetical protein
MRYIKLFEAKKKIPKKSLYEEFFKDKIRDVDYYLDQIKNHKIEGSVSDLFHWSAAHQFPEMVIALLDIIPLNKLIYLQRSITYLDFETFKKVLLKNDLYKSLLSARDFLENVIHYAKTNDRDKIFDFLEKLGFKLNSKLLEIAAFHGQVDLVKYLVKKGLDPGEKISSSGYDDRLENCLDVATNYNTTPDLIKYLVEELNIPVTYRHMYNVVSKDNFDALLILLKSKNRVGDYSYSRYAIQDFYKYPIDLHKLISTISHRNNTEPKYLKSILDSLSIEEQYNSLSALKRQEDFLGFDFPRDEQYNKYLVEPELDLAYDIVSKYNGKESPFITERITHNNEKFWLKKMKQNPSLVSKLSAGMDRKIAKSYKYQKTILDLDVNNVKYIIDKLHPNIMNEYDHIPEVLDLVIKKYNL